MSKPLSSDELGKIEGSYLPQHLLNFPLLGNRVRASWQKDRLQNKSCMRLAVVVFHYQSAWVRRIVKGIATSLVNAFLPDSAPTIDVLTAEASADYLHANTFVHLERHRHEYAAVVTVGAWISKQVRNYMRAHRWTAAQVFVGVPHPGASGLLQTAAEEKEFQNKLIGIIPSVIDYGRYISLLLLMRPQLKTILIPYDPQFIYDGFNEEKERLQYHLMAHNISLKSLELDLSTDVTSQLEPHLDGIDVLWSLQDEATQLHAKVIAKLCSKAGITFCGSDLSCLFQGAAVGFGDSGTLIGAYAAQLCFLLCSGDTHAAHIEHVEFIPSNSMRINANALEKQGIAVTPRERAFLEELVPLGWE